MGMVQVPIPEELTEELEESFYRGAMLNENGVRNLNEDLVDRINKMRVCIEAAEHPPPHFHVRFAGESASFSISDGRRLPNIHGLEEYDHSIQKWWKKNFCTLVSVWNRTRPSSCQVGPMNVPPECLPKDETGEG